MYRKKSHWRNSEVKRKTAICRVDRQLEQRAWILCLAVWREEKSRRFGKNKEDSYILDPEQQEVEK